MPKRDNPAEQLPASNSRLGILSDLKMPYCGSLEEMFRRMPNIHYPEPLVSFDYEGHTSRFLIRFYGHLEDGENITGPEWINKGKFDAFAVYELDDKGEPFRYPTAACYFRNGIAYVLYNFLTSSTIAVPDHKFDSSDCSFVNSDITTVINDIIKTIGQIRKN